MKLTMSLIGSSPLTADQSTRAAAGTVLPYGTPGRTSLGELTVRPGAITLPPSDLTNRVRLLYGHDRDKPIGVAAELTDTPNELHGRFTIARTQLGDTYLAELHPDTPIRDGLSVELDDVELDETGTEIVAGTLIAVAAVPLPAYPEARATLAAERHTMTTTTEEPTTATPPAAPTAAAVVPELARPMAASHSPARTAPVSALREVTARLTAARMNGASAMTAALADITPTGNGPGNADAGLMTQALGELWNGVGYEALYSPLIGSGELTGIKTSGWRWNPAPTVADYAGDKADIPSNPAKLVYSEWEPSRLAGGHDIDRVYRDLGERAVLESYWRHMAESMKVELDARALAAIEAAAGATIGTSSNVMAAVVKGTLAVTRYGRATFAIVAADDVESLAVTPSSEAPAALDGLPIKLPPITPSPDIAPGSVIVGIGRAVRQLTFKPPIRVEAVNIPQGGIDAALFGYSTELSELSAAVVSVTVTPPVAALKASAK